MGGVSITTLIPVPELATWLRDLGARRMKMFETTLTSSKRGHAPQPVNRTAA